MKNWIFLKGILQDLALSFILTCIFELSCFPPSYPPETRDLLYFFYYFFFLSGKNPLMKQKMLFCVI